MPTEKTGQGHLTRYGEITPQPGNCFSELGACMGSPNLPRVPGGTEYQPRRQRPLHLVKSFGKGCNHHTSHYCRPSGAAAGFTTCLGICARMCTLSTVSSVTGWGRCSPHPLATEGCGGRLLEGRASGTLAGEGVAQTSVGASGSPKGGLRPQGRSKESPGLVLPSMPGPPSTRQNLCKKVVSKLQLGGRVVAGWGWLPARWPGWQQGRLSRLSPV